MGNMLHHFLEDQHCQVVHFCHWCQLAPAHQPALQGQLVLEPHPPLCLHWVQESLQVQVAQEVLSTLVFLALFVHLCRAALLFQQDQGILVVQHLQVAQSDQAARPSLGLLPVQIGHLVPLHQLLHLCLVVQEVQQDILCM